MTGINNNIKFVPVAPKTYEVRYVENKQSGLSPAARSKVINRSGSNYLSNNQEGYGPMPNQGCNQSLSGLFEASTNLTGDYVLAYANGQAFAPSRVASGKIEDRDFSGIQKRIDEFKSGRLKVYKGNDTNPNAKRERTQECIKFEGYFEASLENALKELKKASSNDYKYFYFVRP